MWLQRSTWPEVETYLKSSTGIVMPIGSTEQHGPTGLIGTDAICPETIAAGLAAQGILVGPTLSLGMAQHHMAFAGTITLRPSTLSALIHDVVSSLACHGFRHVLFINGHGGNIATVESAFAEIWADFSLAAEPSELRLKLMSWWTGPRVSRLRDELYADNEGSHATPSEIALTWHAYPDEERRLPLEPERAPEGSIRDALDYRRQFPDGRIGSAPAMATREHGARLCEAAVADALEVYQRLLQD